MGKLTLIEDYIYITKIQVLEVIGNTLVVKGIPDEITPKGMEEFHIIGTNIKVTCYMGTFNYGLMYLSSPIILKENSIINIEKKIF